MKRTNYTNAWIQTNSEELEDFQPSLEKDFA